MSTFAQRVAPYASVIVNGIYWAPDSPRLITKEDAKALFARSEANSTQFGIPQRLIGICDISCDVGGSMEFMDTVTTIEQPFCVYDADSDRTSWDIKAPGVVMCSIDNMPAQFPSEATDFFGDLLFPHLSKLLKSDAKKVLRIRAYSSVAQKGPFCSHRKKLYQSSKQKKIICNVFPRQELKVEMAFQNMSLMFCIIFERCIF